MTALTNAEPIVLRRQLLTLKEAGEQLGCSDDTVRTLIREGHLKAVRPPHQGLRVRPADLAEYVESLEAL